MPVITHCNRNRDAVTQLNLHFTNDSARYWLPFNISREVMEISIHCAVDDVALLLKI